MKSKIIFLMFILTMATIIAQNPISFELQEGKNNITINETFDYMYASDLIMAYPQIESISVNEYGRTFGYVNTFGGIGQNIIIEPEREYEIYSRENITIEIKN